MSNAFVLASGKINLKYHRLGSEATANPKTHP